MSSIVIFFIYFIFYKSIGLGTGIVLKVSVMYRYRIKTKRYPSLLISALFTGDPCPCHCSLNGLVVALYRQEVAVFA